MEQTINFTSEMIQQFSIKMMMLRESSLSLLWKNQLTATPFQSQIPFPCPLDQGGSCFASMLYEGRTMTLVSRKQLLRQTVLPHLKKVSGMEVLKGE